MKVLAIIVALPVSGPTDPAQCYASLHEAMDRAAHAALLVSTHYEVGGAIYSQDRRYCYTAPVSQGKAGQIDYRVQIPKGATLSALWHTHPGEYPATPQTADRLSPEDRMLADKVGVPMFIVAIPQNVVVGYHVKGFDL